MGALILAWMPVFLLLYVPRAANLFVVAYARLVHARHDWEIEDDLPMTAGVWVSQRLAALGTHAIVTDDAAPRSSNAYWPNANIIQLTHETYFKADPVYWAVAAHELGHAHLHQRHRLVAFLIDAAAWIKQPLALVGIGIAMGNVLYKLPGVTHLAFVLLATALALDALVLVDEAWASRWAYRELATSAHLTPRHLQAVRAVLASAFATYAVWFLSHVLLLACWPIVERLTSGERPETLAQLGSFGWFVVLGATVLGIAQLLMRAVHAFGSPRARGELLEARFLVNVMVIVFHALILGTIAVVWNLRAGPGWAWCVILAVIPSSNLVRSILSIPGYVPFWFVRQIASHLEGPGIERSAAYERALKAGRPLILEGNLTVTALSDATMLARSVPYRLYELVRLLYVPMLIAFWLF